MMVIIVGTSIYCCYSYVVVVFFQLISMVELWHLNCVN